MSKSRILRLLSLVCVFMVAFSCVSFAKAEKKKVTVMVYMCGSNLESQGSAGTRCLGEMIRSQFNTEDVNVIVLAGGSGSWTNGFSPNRLTMGEVGNSRQIPKTESSLAPMSDPDTLTSFLNQCAERYPADENILIFWNHGGGPVHGVCQDELFDGDTLSLTEITSALKTSPFADHGLDLVLFHACLMGSAELSVAMAPFAKYMVASEDSMYGLTYDWLAGVESRTPLETALNVARSSFAFNNEVIAAQHASEINSFSVVDLSKAQALSDAVDAFFAHVTPDLNDANFTAMSAQRRDSVTFGIGESGNASGFDLVDLGDLVKHYRDRAPAEADAVLSALKEAVVDNPNAVPACTGLTVYHPFENKNLNLLMYRIAVYNELGFAPAYTTYIQSFAAMLTGTRQASWAGLRLKASAKKDQRTLYTMSLTEDQAAHFGTAGLTALVKNPDESYRFTWADDGFTLEDGVLTAEYVHTSLCVTDPEGKPVFYPLRYTRDSNGNYLIAAELTRHEKETEDGIMLPEATHQGLITCTYNSDTRKLTPAGVLVWDEKMGGYTPAFNTVFSDYDEILISIESRTETRDEEGILLPFDEWALSSAEEFRSAIDDTWEFRLLPDLFGNEELYVAFNVTDSQNNHYLSELLPCGAVPQAADVVTEYDDAKLLLINSLSVTPSEGYLNLSMNLTNITDTEAVIALENLKLNQNAVDFTAEAYGNGENWGLLKDEAQILPCQIPADLLGNIDTLTEITFDLSLKDAANPEEIIGTVPVLVKTSLDLTAFR